LVHKGELRKKMLILNPQTKHDFKNKGIQLSQDMGPLFYSEHSFEYSYNLPFTLYLEEKRNKRKINTKISYLDFSNDTIQKYSGKELSLTFYAHLSQWQKVMNSFYFKRLWIQQSSNLMWIINILVALLACIATIWRITSK